MIETLLSKHYCSIYNGCFTVILTLSCYKSFYYFGLCKIIILILLNLHSRCAFMFNELANKLLRLFSITFNVYFKRPAKWRVNIIKKGNFISLTRAGKWYIVTLPRIQCLFYYNCTNFYFNKNIRQRTLKSLNKIWK